MKTLVFPSEFRDGMYRAPYTKSYRPGDIVQFYHKGVLHTEAFREGDNIYLRRTTGDLGALRYKGLFLLNFVSLTLLVALALAGTYQARVMNHDSPNHAFTVAVIAGLGLFLLPMYTIIRFCLYPNPKEFSRWYHRDV